MTTNAYIMYFGVPIALFLVTATIAYKNNSRAIEHRLLAASFLLYIVLFIGEWYRHLIDLKYSPAIIIWSNGMIMILALAMTVHVCAILYEKHTKRKWFLPKSFLYIGLVVHVFIALSPIVPTAADFVREGIWIRRDAPIYELWITLFVLSTMVLNIITCLMAYRQVGQKTKSKQLFRYLLLIIICNAIAFNLLVPLIPEAYRPSIPSLYIMVTLSLLILIGMQRYHLFPQYARRYMMMFDKSPICKFILDEHFNVIEVNRQTKAYFTSMSFQGENFIVILKATNNFELAEPYIQLLQQNKEIADLSISLRHYQTGQPIHLIVHASEIEENGNIIYYVMFRDRTMEVEQEEKIRELAFFDSLTGLPNRASFMQESQLLFNRDTGGALMLLDLNDFKYVNDHYGHAAGDAILQATGTVLHRVSQSMHFPARLGGDEFVLYVKTDQLTMTLPQFIENVRQALQDEIVYFENELLSIKPSIGCAIKMPNMTFDELMHEADQRMYEDKQRIKQQRLS